MPVAINVWRDPGLYQVTDKAIASAMMREPLEMLVTSSNVSFHHYYATMTCLHLLYAKISVMERPAPASHAQCGTSLERGERSSAVHMAVPGRKDAWMREVYLRTRGALLLDSGSPSGLRTRERSTRMHPSERRTRSRFASTKSLFAQRLRSRSSCGNVAQRAREDASGSR